MRTNAEKMETARTIRQTDGWMVECWFEVAQGDVWRGPKPPGTGTDAIELHRGRVYGVYRDVGHIRAVYRLYPHRSPRRLTPQRWPKTASLTVPAGALTTVRERMWLHSEARHHATA